MGLHFEDDKLDHLAEVLRNRVEDHGRGSAPAYLEQLAAGRRDELRTLARQLTVGETYFFRYNDHFRAFADVVLPDRMRHQQARRTLRILSAGCSSGEEAYTLAILVREHLPNPASWDVRILGVDINPTMVEKAARARYSAWSLRETPPGTRERYFRTCGRDFQLHDEVRTAVSFEERNLLDDDALFWQPDSFDVVFCRNVTMYFSPEVMRSVVARITRSLTVGGFLFLGHAETLRGVSQDHHLCHTHGTFYYQRRDADHRIAAEDSAPTGPEAAPAAAPSLAAALDLDDSSWVEVIQGASNRIAKLSQPARPSPRAPAAAVAPPPAWDLGPALELLGQERFADAMALLQALPADSRKDADAQLLRAVVLTNGGKLAEAELACQEILLRDELHAGAHYLVALCREHEGDLAAAVEHDQVATYLDPGFAMPHLHLGLLAMRSGATQARGELERALTLLAREDASRILLYGGGFSRDTLVELCRAELRLCGGGT